MYFKPYTKMIDNLCMLVGYQPLKFQSFNGKGNSKQHLIHYVKTCNNAGTEGDLIVKQFVHSLTTKIDYLRCYLWKCAYKECIGVFYTSSKGCNLIPLKSWLFEHMT